MLQQTVNVHPRRAPRAGASALDSTHLLVEFDVPVRSGGARVLLASGVPLFVIAGQLDLLQPRVLYLFRVTMV